MAVAQNIISRRGMLAGLAAAPILAVPASALVLPPLDAVSRWSAAQKRVSRTQKIYERTQVKFNTAEEAYFKNKPRPLNATASEAGDTPQIFNDRAAREKMAFAEADRACRDHYRLDEANAANNAAFNDYFSAIDDLIATPAPDFTAVIVKLDIGQEYDGVIEDFSPIIADIRRLSK